MDGRVCILDGRKLLDNGMNHLSTGAGFRWPIHFVWKNNASQGIDHNTNHLCHRFPQLARDLGKSEEHQPLMRIPWGGYHSSPPVLEGIIIV